MDHVTKQWTLLRVIAVEKHSSTVGSVHFDAVGHRMATATNSPSGPAWKVWDVATGMAWSTM